jgi:AcrR family transcriptional regulator
MLAVPGGEPLTWTSLSVEAQVSRRTLYTHWTSIEELMTDLIQGSSVIGAADTTEPAEARLRAFLMSVRERAADPVNFTVMLTAARAEKAKESPEPDASIYRIVDSWIESFQNTVAPLSREQYYLLAGPIVFQELFSVTSASDSTIDALVAIGLDMIEKLPGGSSSS